VAAPSLAHVASLAVLLFVSAIDVTASQGEAAIPVCIGAGLADGDLDDLIAGAVEVLRRSGHAAEDYRMELTMERPQGSGFADRSVQLYPSVVFHPDADGRYPLRVDRNAPCSVSWVWRPDRFTAWQRSVLVRAREVLRDAWPDGSGEELSGVIVVETAAEVIVRLSMGAVDESGLALSLAEITLRKSDLGEVD
jgi:hypothetical protein